MTSGDFLGAHPLWVGITVSFVLGSVLGTGSFLLWRLARRSYAGAKVDDESGTSPTLFSPMLKCVEDLAFLETFEDGGSTVASALEIIGRGGCGEVYKAELVTGERVVTVAVKRILQPAAGASQLCDEESGLLSLRMRQIRSEIMTVGRLKHPNLLRLLAHVPRPNHHYLVYEFMPNGSLHDVLKAVAEGRIILDWPARHRIALGVAAGLEYLHMVHRPRIIHRDLKPANILLDNKMDARIADFGLAKLVPDAFSFPMTVMSSVAGTVGYIAPEYYQTMVCTDKCDMYSFGVIVAVLVTGKFPNDRFFETTDERCIMEWVRGAIGSEDPTAVIDRMLLGDGFEEELILALKIACFCTYVDPRKRPNSRDVRCMLAQIKH